MCVCEREREAMAAAQGKYAPIIRPILKSAWGAIPLSRSPALLLLLPCFAISHRCILSWLTCLFPPPTFYFSSVCPPICSFSAPQLRRALPQLSSRFLTLGNVREISPPLEFRGPAGSACHHLKVISLLTQTVWTKANSYHFKIQ